MDREKPDAILMVTDALTLLNRKRVFDYAAAHQLPAIYEQDFMTRDGGLMSYGAEARNSSIAPPRLSPASSRARSPPTCRLSCRRATSS